MLKRIISCIPNSITCLNLISGCVAIYMAFHLNEQFGALSGGEWAALAMGAAAVFDFLDGFAARLLHAFSPLGGDLDSLSDMVSFGVAPAAMLANMMLSAGTPPGAVLPVLIIPVCGAIRLATFNTDGEQSVNFRGLPIPANAIFWIGFYGWVQQYGYPGWPAVDVLAVLVALAMTARFRMFSLKFKTWGLAENFARYALILAAVLFVVFNGLAGLMWTIVFYFFLSLMKRRRL